MGSPPTWTNPRYQVAVLVLVELEGIEPSLLRCQRSVLPLNYSPMLKRPGQCPGRLRFRAFRGVTADLVAYRDSNPVLLSLNQTFNPMNYTLVSSNCRERSREQEGSRTPKSTVCLF